MTQAQRSDVWSRKLALQRDLNLIPDTKENKEKRAPIISQIESCNQELITDNYKPPIIEDEAPSIAET